METSSCISHERSIVCPDYAPAITVMDVTINKRLEAHQSMPWSRGIMTWSRKVI